MIWHFLCADEPSVQTPFQVRETTDGGRSAVPIQEAWLTAQKFS
jgi:hypothetical protein